MKIEGIQALSVTSGSFWPPPASFRVKSQWNSSAKMFSDIFLLYSTATQLRYPQLHYFRSYAILNWVQKNWVNLFLDPQLPYLFLFSLS